MMDKPISVLLANQQYKDLTNKLGLWLWESALKTDVFTPLQQAIYDLLENEQKLTNTKLEQIMELIENAQES